MAEGFLRALGGDRFEAASAGTEATRVHPLAIRVMDEVGIDLGGHSSKTFDQFLTQPWDCVITAENARCYKPRPEVYRTAMELLGLSAGEVMMVAAHNYDLRAAQAQGMRTAFIPRPTEYGPGQATDLAPEGDWDIVTAPPRNETIGVQSSRAAAFTRCPRANASAWKSCAACCRNRAC